MVVDERKELFIEGILTMIPSKKIFKKHYID